MMVGIDWIADTIETTGLSKFDPVYPEKVIITVRAPEWMMDKYELRTLAVMAFNDLKDYLKSKGVPRFKKESILNNVKEVDIIFIDGKEKPVSRTKVFL